MTDAETPRDKRVNEDMLAAFGIDGCGCWECVHRIVSARPFPENLAYPFIVCETCGNKRCQHAQSHENACTGSNAPGQPGATRYPVLSDGEREAALAAFRSETEQV